MSSQETAASTIEIARRMIAAAHRPVAFSGAGLSAESGIPTFRDAGTGFWSKFSPEQLASLEGFEQDPELVIAWYAERRRALADARPNAAHLALARRQWPQVTQNVDDLLQRAGASNVMQLHGSITHDRCHGNCGHLEAVDLADPPGLRDCPRCPSRMRPAVVWFGEMLPQHEWHAAEQACRRSDLLLVIGTSAVVYPAAGLIELAKDCGAGVIVVNAETNGASRVADVTLIGKAGEVVPQLLLNH